MTSRIPLQRARRAVLALLACALPRAFVQSARAQDRSIVMASTTSTEQSGLFPHLLPAFTKATGIQVKVVAVGTGQALDMGRRGDADVLFVHDRAAEDKFVAEGWGLPRRDVMYNDFVLVGPKGDPAGETTQSENACARSRLTCGCFAGLTTMTPYWLKRRVSPSTRISSSPRF